MNLLVAKKHQAILNKCQQAVQQVFRKAVLEFGPDSMVVIDASSDPYSVEGIPRTEMADGLHKELETEAPELKVIRNPAPQGFFYLIILGKSGAYSCFKQAIRPSELN